MNNSSTESVIKWGRITLVTSVAFEIAAVLTVFITKQVRLDPKETDDFRRRFTEAIGWVFGAMSVLLLVNILWLISRLKK